MSQVHKPNDAHSTANQCPRRASTFAGSVRVSIVQFVCWRYETPPRHRLASLGISARIVCRTAQKPGFAIGYGLSSYTLRGMLPVRCRLLRVTGRHKGIQTLKASHAMTPASVYCSICGKKMKFEGVVPRAGFGDVVTLFSCGCGHTQLADDERETLRS